VDEAVIVVYVKHRWERRLWDKAHLLTAVGVFVYQQCRHPSFQSHSASNSGVFTLEFNIAFNLQNNKKIPMGKCDSNLRTLQMSLPFVFSLVFTFKLAVNFFYLSLIRVGTGRFSNCQEFVLLTILKGLHVINCIFY